MEPAATAAPGGGRFVVAAPSIEALAQKAQAECETAVPFARKVRNVSDRRVAVLPKPNVQCEGTGQHIEPGEIFDVVARCYRPQDGRTYLRLRQSEGGWICTRSRREFWKVVLDSMNGTNLDTSGIVNDDSRAKQYLGHVSFEGIRIDAEGKPEKSAVASNQSWRFRVLGRTLPILDQPSLTDSTSMACAMLQPREEIVADAVHPDPRDGRSYLHLKDGRGWVCERSKADFCKFAMEPLNEEDDPASKAKRVPMGEGQRKVLVVERKEAASPKSAPSAKAPRCSTLEQEPVVLRSDAELWPKALGGPHPIGMDTRKTLQKLFKYYGSKMRESEADLKLVESKIKTFTVSCPGKKQLESHAEMLRKEIEKVEKQWIALVEKDTANVSPSSKPKASPSLDNAVVAPVQVLGQPWHCATLRVEDRDEDEWHVGPLRAQESRAAEDLELMVKSCGKSPRKRPNGATDGTEAKKIKPSANID